MYLLSTASVAFAGASSDMDDVDPENLRNLQAVAEEYVSSISDVLTQMCADLKEVEEAICQRRSGYRRKSGETGWGQDLTRALSRACLPSTVTMNSTSRALCCS